MDSMLTGVLVVAGAAALALILRATSRGDETMSGAPPAASEPGPDETPGGVDEALAGAPGPDSEFAVLCSEGWTFVPFGAAVRLWAPAGEDAETGGVPAADAAPAAGMVPRHREAAKARPAVVLSAGDLSAARVVPGTPGEAPWCVETLGRDREFSAWSFETEDAAHAAREMLARLVVRAPLGTDGEPEPVSDAEFDEARHVAEETLRELATMPEAEPPEEPR